MANIEGKATAITVLNPVKRWGPIWLWLVFWIGRHIPATLRSLERLSFIHYARWVVIKHFPGEDGGQRLNYSYLMFESNFNGTWDQYIDAFSEVVAFSMRAIWGSSFGFPGPLPVEPFKAYIRHNELVANHYWSAYPGATTTEILSAARVQSTLEDFIRSSAGLEPEAFRASYESFLAAMQGDL